MATPVYPTVSVYKKTSDDWSSSFRSDEGNLVAVHLDNFGDRFWQITCHGRDLYMITPEKMNLTYERALPIFLKIIGLEDVTIKAVRDLGFSTLPAK